MLPAQAVLIIDDFDTYSSLTVTGPPSGPMSTFAAYSTTEAIGGERDVFIERTSNNSGAVATDISGSFASQLSYASAPFTTGNLLLSYDGSDASSALNPTGLGGIDFTQSGINTGIFLRSASDLGASITMTILSDANHSSFYTLSIAADPSFSFFDYFAPFSSFTSSGALGGANFSSVGAFTLLLSGNTAGTDVSLDTVVAAPVPEPGSSLLLLTTGLAFLVRRRLRR